MKKTASCARSQDCVLFLQAQKLGLVVLTANLSDYDILLQLIPTGRRALLSFEMTPHR